MYFAIMCMSEFHFTCHLLSGASGRASPMSLTWSFHTANTMFRTLRGSFRTDLKKKLTDKTEFAELAYLALAHVLNFLIKWNSLRPKLSSKNY